MVLSLTLGCTALNIQHVKVTEVAGLPKQSAQALPGTQAKSTATNVVQPVLATQLYIGKIVSRPLSPQRDYWHENVRPLTSHTGDEIKEPQDRM